MIKKLFLKDRFILWLILINAAILFLAGYFTSDSAKHLFVIADNLLTSLFIIELIVKFNEYGIKGYFKSGWNRLDFVLIIVSVPALLSFVLNIQAFDVSYLLVFRIFRVFKAFRFFKFIPNVGGLIADVKRALDTSLFILIGFLIYIFIVGTLSFYLFSGNNTEFFTTPTISLYSTFKIFTVEGWYEIPEAISANYSSVATFFYLPLLYICCGYGWYNRAIASKLYICRFNAEGQHRRYRK